MFIWKFLRDEDGTGGGPAAAKAGDDPNATTTTPGDGGEKGGEKTTLDPEAMAAKITDLEKQFKEVDDKNKDLAKKLGKQSDQVGAYKKITEAYRVDPAGFLRSVAADTGLKVSILDGKAPDLSSLVGDDGNLDATKAEAIIEVAENRAYDRFRREHGAQTETLFKQQLSQRYKDFDTLTDDRELLKARTLSKELSSDELYHLAAQGMNLADALEAAEVRGREAYRKELADKAKGIPADPGSSTTTDGQPQKHDPKDAKYFEGVVAAMRKAR
jgi:hypothetical protein